MTNCGARKAGEKPKAEKEAGVELAGGCLGPAPHCSEETTSAAGRAALAPNSTGQGLVGSERLQASREPA